MISNVTKSADVLRGNTEWQDLWLEIEKMRPKEDLKGPRVLKNHIMEGKVRDEQEARYKLELLCHKRQQATNFYMSDSAKTLRARKTNMSAAERKKSRDRLCTPSRASPPRGKATTNVGHLMNDGSASPSTPTESPKARPKSKAQISSPHTETRTSKQRSRGVFEGLTMREFYNKDWAPSFEYRPADHTAEVKNGLIVRGGPWKEVRWQRPMHRAHTHARARRARTRAP